MQTGPQTKTLKDPGQSQLWGGTGPRGSAVTTPCWAQGGREGPPRKGWGCRILFTKSTKEGVLGGQCHGSHSKG